jgi:hypothetical protein
VPLGPSLPHLGREILDRLHATRELLARGASPSGELAGTVLRPPPWLELARTWSHDGGAFRPRDARLGAWRIDPDELALLEAADGRTLGALAQGAAGWERALSLVERGLLVV